MEKIIFVCGFEGTCLFIFLDSSMVEHSAVNRRVVGSSPTRGVKRKPAINKLPFLITFLAPWSSGQDIALSRR